MTDNKRKRSGGISNSKPADSTSKIIFEDNILCSQFLRDYVDLPYMKDVRPEDIEDVSEQYVSLFAEERNADRVKKVNIRNEKPFFLVSLIEHKSSLDYNVSMQVFRYMVYIWETYAKEAEKMQKGVTKRADFKYPPILPIVYYEGAGKWTVPLDFKGRILEGDTFGKYIPNFEYYLVPLRRYSNEELLAKGDEISLVMMINRMQNQKDVETFRQLPAGEVESILQETPEHLLNIISDILRSFLMRMRMPEQEAEALVGKVKEKKMGILFEHVVPFDIDKAKREAEEVKRTALAEVEEAKRVAQAEVEEAKRVAQAEVEEAKRVAQAETEAAKEAAKEAAEQNVRIIVETCQELTGSKDIAFEKLKEKAGLETKIAREKVERYWKS